MDTNSVSQNISQTESAVSQNASQTATNGKSTHLRMRKSIPDLTVNDRIALNLKHWQPILRTPGNKPLTPKLLYKYFYSNWRASKGSNVFSASTVARKAHTSYFDNFVARCEDPLKRSIGCNPALTLALYGSVDRARSHIHLAYHFATNYQISRVGRWIASGLDCTNGCSLTCNLHTCASYHRPYRRDSSAQVSSVTPAQVSQLRCAGVNHLQTESEAIHCQTAPTLAHLSMTTSKLS